MPRRFRFALRPGWLAGHLLVLALAVTMILLGRWQLDVSNSKGFDLQNFGYALQWWAFTIFGVVMWVKIVRDHGRNAAADEWTDSLGRLPTAPLEPPVAYRRYVMPQSADGPAPAADPTHAAYNDYLARLSDSPAAQARRQEDAE